MNQEKPNYLMEMLSTQANLWCGLGAAATGVLMSFPYGSAGFIPVVLYGAFAVVAGLVIPEMPTFKEKVDKKYREQARQNAANHLKEQILKYADNEDSNWNVYYKMVERIHSLNDFAKNVNSHFSERDLEKMLDASINYLGMWLALLVMEERIQNIDERDLKNKLALCEKQLKDAGGDKRRIEKTRTEILAILQRHAAIPAKKTAVETAMFSIRDAVEEIYQTTVTSQSSGEATNRLKEAVDRLHIEEALENDTEFNLDALLPSLNADIVAQPLSQEAVKAAKVPLKVAR